MFSRWERGRTGCVRPGDYWRWSAFDYYNGGGHGDVAGQEGRIDGGRSFSGQKMTMDENPQKHDIFGLSSMYGLLTGQRTFFGRRYIG